MTDQYIKRDLAGVIITMTVLLGIIVGLAVVDSRTNFITKSGRTIFQQIIQ